MNKTAIIVGGVAWVLTMGGAYYAGKSGQEGGSVLTDSSSRGATGEVRVGDLGTGLGVTSTGGAGVDGTQTDGSLFGDMGNAANNQGGSLEERMNTLLSSDDLVARNLEMARLLQNLSPENLEEIKVVFDSLGASWGHHAEIQMFLYAWGKFDPQSAMEYGMNTFGGRGAMMSGAVMREWMKSDPTAAQAWAETLNGREKESVAGMILRIQSEEDPQLAAQSLVNSNTEGRNNWQTRMVVERFANADPVEAAKWAESLEDSRLKGDAMREVAENWAATDLQSAANWARSQAGKPGGAQAVREVVQAMARENPMDALSWVNSLPVGEAKTEGTSAIARQWAREDPTAASAWMNQLPKTPESDPVVSSFARTIAQDDPEIAIDWALTISDDNMKNSTLGQIGRDWVQSDPEAARQWIESSELPDSVKRSMQRRGRGRGR